MMTVAVDLFHFGHVFLKLNLGICKLLYSCFTSSVLERLCPCPAPCGIYKKIAITSFYGWKYVYTCKRHKRKTK